MLTTLAVLLTEVVVFLPSIAHERNNWLRGRVEDAAIALLSASGSPIDPAKAADLLHLAGATSIRLIGPSGPLVVGTETGSPALEVDLRQEDVFAGIGHALHSLIVDDNRLIQLDANNPFLPGSEVVLTLREHLMSRALRRFAGDFASLSLMIAGVTGGLVYLAVLILLVRPMRRITGSIAAFRANPEHTMPFDPGDLSVLPNDEITVAAQELAQMQHELRAALWRNARLAALGTVVAKVSHDLRGILTPALLTAERLQLNADARVQRAGETLANAVDRATDLVRRTLDYAREGPPPLDIVPVELVPLIDEAAESAKQPGRAFRCSNVVDPAIVVRADRNQLFRVLTNLIRNAAEAGARVVSVSAQHNSPTLALEIADDGPGLPEQVQAELFRPFAGSTRRGGTGLGLAIARDLMVAHGGTIELVGTGASGTTFRLTMRLSEIEAQTAAAHGSARIAPAASADV
jgi:signal transduction histidine kinase